MITIERFIDAYRLHQEGRCPHRLLQDQAAVLINTCRHSYRPIENPLNVSDVDIAWLLQQPEASQSYANLLGGHVHICETPNDLHQIQGCDFDWAAAHGGKWPYVTDTPIAWDACRKLLVVTGETKWALLLQIWSDAGGPTYYLPKQLWQAARLDEHLAATNQVWDS